MFIACDLFLGHPVHNMYSWRFFSFKCPDDNLTRLGTADWRLGRGHDNCVLTWGVMRMTCVMRAMSHHVTTNHDRCQPITSVMRLFYYYLFDLFFNLFRHSGDWGARTNHEAHQISQVHVHLFMTVQCSVPSDLYMYWSKLQQTNKLTISKYQNIPLFIASKRKWHQFLEFQSRYPLKVGQFSWRNMNMVKKEDAGDKMIVNSNRSYRHHDTLRKACYVLSSVLT